MHLEADNLLGQLKALHEDVCRTFFEAAKRDLFGFCKSKVCDVKEAEEITTDALNLSLAEIVTFETMAEFKAYTFGCARKMVLQNWEHATAQKRDPRKTVSLHAGTAGEDSLEDQIPDPNAYRGDGQDSTTLMDVALDEALMKLGEPCSTLVRERFMQGRTLKECAKDREASIARVFVVTRKCLERLRILTKACLRELTG